MEEIKTEIISFSVEKNAMYIPNTIDKEIELEGNTAFKIKDINRQEGTIELDETISLLPLDKKINFKIETTANFVFSFDDAVAESESMRSICFKKAHERLSDTIDDILVLMKKPKLHLSKYYE